jgi:tagatose 1,6-diphosphate aldolase GatY/KbaY
MPLTTTLSLLRDAQKNSYAVGAFNVENMEMVQAVLAAAENARSPLIVQTTPGTLRYADVKVYAAMVKALAKDASVPVALHLDHGDSFALAIQALHAGYTSLMIDGSHLSLDGNIALTARVVECAAACGLPVEGELGKIGGKEDDLDVSTDAYTDPDTAVAYVRGSGVSSLAVAIGTAHGVYATTPVLDVERLKQIRQKVDIPLVLHGASGLTTEQVQECVANGICKVNFATELRMAYTDGVKKVLSDKPETYDPKNYGKVARENVIELVVGRMEVCGCAGKAR